MRVSLNWLKEYVAIDVSAEQLAADMTMLGLEIEAVHRPGDGVARVVVGRIESITPHPDADKLVVCQTNVGGAEPLQIVCGAKNMKAGDKVPTAVEGATLPGGFSIGRRKMRGVESQGMMCSARELGLGEDHAGLLILEEDAPVGADAVALLGLDDTIFEVEITPNRGDWAGMVGIARELAALYGKALCRPRSDVKESGAPVKTLANVSIEIPGRCPRYMGRVIEGVRIAPSPGWLARRLQAAGLRPINNVVDVTNLVLLETAHPLHAFDYAKLGGHEIRVRLAAQGETIKTIDGHERKLDPDDLVIADAARPVAIAGAMGGLDSEVGEDTTSILLESAVFEPTGVRRTARRHGLQTEASQRFQRGADPAMAAYAIERAAMLIQEIAGGTVAAGVLDEHPLPRPERTLTLRYGRANRLLGTEVTAAEQRSILDRLGFKPVSQDEETVTVAVPSWRQDVSLEADLIEEVARLHGYDKVPMTVPGIRQNPEVFAPHEERIRALRQYLAYVGLTEHVHWTFSNPKEITHAGLGQLLEAAVRIENPLSEQQSVMRVSLMPGMLKTVSSDIRHGRHDIAAFEVGPVYREKPGKELPEQGYALGLVLTGARQSEHWSENAPSVNWYDMKGHVEGMLDFLGVSCTFQGVFAGQFADGTATKIITDTSFCAGYFGEVHGAVAKAFDIEQTVYFAELDLSTLVCIPQQHRQFQAYPDLPSSLRDLAVVLDEGVPAGDVLGAVNRSGGELLKKATIFDVYTGEQVPAGKKSLALKLVFQSNERTLTDAETQGVVDRIFAALEKAFGAQIR